MIEKIGDSLPRLTYGPRSIACYLSLQREPLPNRLENGPISLNVSVHSTCSLTCVLIRSCGSGYCTLFLLLSSIKNNYFQFAGVEEHTLLLYLLKVQFPKVIIISSSSSSISSSYHHHHYHHSHHYYSFI